MNDLVNVLLVVLEGARPDHLSCAGYHLETTPFLDQLAREGVRFPLAFSTAPSPVAAYASLLTGLLPSLHGATEETGVLGSTPRVIGEQLKRRGYRTAVFGPDAVISPAVGFGRGFDRWYAPRGTGRLTGRAAAYARRASDRVLGRADGGARRTTEALLDWLGGSREPFFALVRYGETLQPSRPPAPYDRLFPGGDASALHDGALRYLDMRLKQVAEALIAAREWDRTVCIVTSTHAEALGEPVPEGHALLRDAVLRVPLLVRCPDRLPAGYVVEDLAQHVDIAPTIAALTGTPAGDVQGRALFSEHGATPGPRAILAEAFRAAAGGVRRKAIRTRHEKLIWQSDEDNALFDLRSDPDERVNLAAAEPARADRLRRLLFDTLAEAERWGSERGLLSAEAPTGAPLEQRETGD